MSILECLWYIQLVEAEDKVGISKCHATYCMHVCTNTRVYQSLCVSMSKEAEGRRGQ